MKITITFVAAVLFVGTHTGSYDDMTRLQTDLLAGYVRNVRPLQNQDDVMNVGFMYSMPHFQEFDAVKGTLTTYASISLSWTDEKLRWTPSNYGDIDRVYFTTLQVWYPIIVAATGVNSLLLTPTSSITVFHTGHAMALATEIILSSCAPDITYYPYDIHNCSIMFASLEPYTAVTFHGRAQDMDIIENLFWSIKRNGFRSDIAYNYTSTIEVSYTLERRPTYLVYTIVLPVCLLNVAILLAFILPAESGERVSYATTMLLTLTVYMTIMSDSIPNTSDPVSLLTISLMVKLIISAIVVLAVISTLCIYNTPDTKPIPQWLAFCCIQKKQKIDTTHEQMESKNDAVNEMDLYRSVITWHVIGRRVDKFFLILFSVMITTETIVNMVRITHRL
ncbi:neuronal acetylcholine receptor subunit alpha-3-like [Argopecten irradians]|uniref:neuronal acetylcholine receptor subunit alpha-3-like n=1 Tax=Argopecten irradians TaxID=31199 RepID=UPI003719D474